MIYAQLSSIVANKTIRRAEPQITPHILSQERTEQIDAGRLFKRPFCWGQHQLLGYQGRLRQQVANEQKAEKK
ncbi:hypothetical protein GCM10027592_32120 [Spirosoma flavus]